MKNILHTEKLETFQTIDGLQITQALFRYVEVNTSYL
jgi:hypothetical protein